MGILNVTIDSFSDGGKYIELEKALRRALEMEKEGADIIDIGGESSGPGSKGINQETELKRTIPLIKEIRKHSKIPISIDTTKAEIASQAIEAGANMINDVSAMRGDKQMAKVAAEKGCPIILMYSKDPSARTTVKETSYDDVLESIKEFLQERIKTARDMGIKRENIIIDPGMGHFISANPKYSLEVIARLSELKELGHPILIGLSRKSFLGGEIEDRDKIGLPLTTIAYLNGASIIRTHNVKMLCQQWN